MLAIVEALHLAPVFHILPGHFGRVRSGSLRVAHHQVALLLVQLRMHAWVRSYSSRQRRCSLPMRPNVEIVCLILIFCKVAPRALRHCSLLDQLFGIVVPNVLLFLSGLEAIGDQAWKPSTEAADPRMPAEGSLCEGTCYDRVCPEATLHGNQTCPAIKREAALKLFQAWIKPIRW